MRRVRHQLAVQGGHEFLDLGVHLPHLLAHVENDSDARNVYAQVERQ